jgi:hypothetical protein
MTSPRFILIVIAAVAPLALTAPIGIKSRFADVVDIASKTYERVRITYARGPSFKSLLSAAACGPVDEQQSHPWSAKQVRSHLPAPFFDLDAVSGRVHFAR